MSRREMDVADLPGLAIAEQIAAGDPAARRAPVEEIIADAIGARAAFAVGDDGSVRVGFGAVDAGHPVVPITSGRRPEAAELLDGRAVGAFLVHAAELRQQLGVDLSELDMDRVAELLRQRALARHAELERSAANGRVAQRELTAAEALRAERRARLLRELSSLDSEVSEPGAAPEERRGWRWSR